MIKIDTKYKKPLTGHYNPGVYKCDSCREKLLFDTPFGSVHKHITGFSEIDGESVAIIECPKCFEKWFFHARLWDERNTYTMFIDSVENGANLHY